MRCTICDRSDVGLSLYHLEEHEEKILFYDDPTGLGFICSECIEDYISQMNEFYMEDEDA